MMVPMWVVWWVAGVVLTLVNHAIHGAAPAPTDPTFDRYAIPGIIVCLGALACYAMGFREYLRGGSHP
jgi:hypothetical protein